LLEHAVGMWAADGMEFLQVETPAPSKHDVGYAKTKPSVSLTVSDR